MGSALTKLEIEFLESDKFRERFCSDCPKAWNERGTGFFRCPSDGEIDNKRCYRSEEWGMISDNLREIESTLYFIDKG